MRRARQFIILSRDLQEFVNNLYGDDAGRASKRPWINTAPMAALLLSLSDIRLSFGGTALFEGVELQAAPRARIALAGRNGSGKSTLLKIAAGLIEPDSGERFAHPKADIRYLPQEPDFSIYPTLDDCAASILASEADQHSAAILFEEFSIDASIAPKDMSGGELRRAAIAMTLAGDPDLLLLDEPTNHLDIPAIAMLEDKLMSMSSALILVSHDRRFLETVTTQTVWIDQGKTRTLNQGFAKFETWRDKILEEEKAALHKLGRKIVAEEHWMRYGVTARRKRNMRRVGELREMRRALREARRPQGAVKFSASEGETSGKRVITADRISKSYDGRKIIDSFSTKIARGDRIGVVGPNGAGKTTLIRMLIGDLAPDAGKVDLGANLQVISLDQKRESLKPHLRLADAIADQRGDWVTINGAKRHVASYLKDFLFAPEQWRSPVEALSGGERARLALAAILAKPSNLMVLDEPTNDLDLETLDLLEELLVSYEGTLLLVSHDRSFLDSVVTSIITPDPEDPAIWRQYAGGYDDMVAQRGAPPGKQKTASPVKQSARQKPAAAPKSARKLSYKEQYALETLPDDIAAMQEKIRALKDVLDDPALYARDPDHFRRSAKELSDVEAALGAAEEEWLRLELKRETLEKG